MTKHDANRWLILLLIGYLAVTVTYSVVNPLFEAPDEHHHFAVAHFLAETGQLPVIDGAADAWLGQEAAQPPLYYGLASVLLRPIAVEYPVENVWINPFVQLGDAGSPTNRNFLVHTSAEMWPWQDWALGVHVLRLFSVALGLGTLFFIFGAGNTLWPDKPYRALLATTLVAFLPQFNFLHSYVNNDVLIIFLASAALWQLIWMWQNSRVGGLAVSWSRLGLLGLTIGLALLSKTAGLLLLVYAVGFLLVLAWAHRWSWRRLVGAWAVVGSLALLIGGWLLVRNWQLYGDPTAANQFVLEAGGNRGFTLAQVLSEWPAIWRSLIGVFGWFNVTPPSWVLWLWTTLIVLSIVGAFLQRRATRTHTDESGPQRWGLPLLLAGWVVLVYAGMVLFLLQTKAAQGRLLFPALLPVALGLGYGLSQWLDRLHQPVQRRVAMAFAGILLVTTFYCALFVIRPIYALPEISAEIPPTAAPVHKNLGFGVELVAAELKTESTHPGDIVWLDLYWTTQQPPQTVPEVVITIFGRENTLIGKLQSYHGGGLFPANLWKSGQVIHSRVGIRLDEAAVAPTQARVNVALVNGADTDVGLLTIRPNMWTNVDNPIAYLGDDDTKIGLVSAEIGPDVVQPGSNVAVSVTWAVIDPPGRDLTTLLHVGPSDVPPLAQGDAVPLSGDYPTHLWQAGEAFEDNYVIHIPDELSTGFYPLWIGLYDADFNRLPVSVDGQLTGSDVFQIGTLAVEK